jgi:hypothetical protein
VRTTLQGHGAGFLSLGPITHSPAPLYLGCGRRIGQVGATGLIMGFQASRAGGEEEVARKGTRCLAKCCRRL